MQICDLQEATGLPSDRAVTCCFTLNIIFEGFFSLVIHDMMQLLLIPLLSVILLSVIIYVLYRCFS